MSAQRKKTKTRAAKAADTSAFADVFESAEAAVAEAAWRLREVVLATAPDLDENVSGGSKVRLVLYSLDGPSRVVCGIQPAAGRCMFYVHRIEPDDVPEHTLAGKGKHAKRIDFATADTVDASVVERLVRVSIERMDRS